MGLDLDEVICKPSLQSVMWTCLQVILKFIKTFQPADMCTFYRIKPALAKISCMLYCYHSVPGILFCGQFSK